MSLCTAVMTDAGLVLCSDTRMNSGVDHVATYRKLFAWDRPGDCVVFLQCAGNLSHAQTVATKIGGEIASSGPPIESLAKVAEHAGATLQSLAKTAGSQVNLALLVSGQCRGERPRIFLVYPEGNYIEGSEDTPHLSLGEHKYGKPLLDAGHDRSAALTESLRLLLGSFDLTLRSNMAVGLPLDHAVYPADTLRLPEITRLDALPENALVTTYLRQFYAGKSGAIPNPVLSARGTSYFAKLEELDRVLEALKQHIRGINDPERLGPDIQAARGYVAAFQGFLDVNGAHPPAEIPAEINGGLIAALRRVNWAQVSDQAQKWVARALEILTRL